MLNNIKDAFGGLLAKIDEINRRYATPRVKMTPTVKFALLVLRLYLVLLLLILGYKFLTMLKG